MNRQTRPGLVAILILECIAAAPAAEIYVNAGNAGAQTGAQQSPFRTVQAAIDAADNGDEIRVAAGTYVENLRVEGKAIVLRGGYSASWVRDLVNSPCTLNGAGGNAVINLIEADATIDGFRITAGTGSTEEVPYGYHGGGIYSRDGSPTITNNVIEANSIISNDPPVDYNLGGGIYVSGGALATILNNVVRGNSAGRGAGIAVTGAQAALIQGNTIENNTAVGDHGGGLFIAVVDASITQNIIRGNEVGRDLGYGWGGGLIIVGQGNSAELAFNTVYGNFAAAYGSGEFIDEGASAEIHHELIFRNVSKDGCEAVSAIAVDGGEGVGSRATISHCTVVGNVCPDSTRGNGLQVEGGSTVSVTNSIFWNNGGDDFAVFDGTLSITYTCSQEAYAGTGNFSADPGFVDAPADDYHLAAGSPCIDAGDPGAPADADAAGGGTRADLGRFGGATDASAHVPSGGTPNDGGAADSAGGSSDDDGDAGDDSQGDSAGDSGVEEAGGSTLGVGACPSAAALLLSFSLIGLRRPAGRAARGRLAVGRSGSQSHGAGTFQ